MRTIIAGSRPIDDYDDVAAGVAASQFTITEVVSGAARGPDLLGEEWAIRHGIPIKRFVPDWDNFPRAAGIMRNDQMADYADALIAIYDGESRGTLHMIQSARRRGLRVYVHLVPFDGSTLSKYY